MNVLSLCSGAGGFDLGFERAGHTIIGQCEIDPIARSVLRRHWPDVPCHEDIRTLDGPQLGVRRLTPVECERLMNWPDGWTAITHDGRPIADSHRYRLIGNGVVASVAEWIGRRIGGVL